jgi:ADP-heptose:LPS heptosyltransferase
MSLTRMGDMVQSTPLLAGLRGKYPRAHITLMVSSDFAAFAERIPFIDDTIVFNLRQFNEKRSRDGAFTWVEVYRYLEDFLRRTMDRKYDTVFNLSHSKLSALMISYMRIPHVRGFYCNETGNRMTEHPWLQYFGIEPFNRPYNPFNLADIYMRAGDVDSGCRRVAIKTDDADPTRVRNILRDADIRDDELLIGIQAGSSLEHRRWPARSFAELADMLVSGLNARIVLLGVESESRLAAEICSLMRMRNKTVDLTGKTDIAGLVGMLRRCRYLVTNDTGTMHVAAALGTRIVGLFFAHAYPRETGPYAPGHVIFHARIPCAPCSYGVHCNNIVCVRKVYPRDVYSLVESHAKTGAWTVPPNLATLDEASIVETKFDADGLLKFHPLIKRPITKRELMVSIYRMMWLESLSGGDLSRPLSTADLDCLAEAVREDYIVDGIGRTFADSQTEIGVFRELTRLARQGVKVAGNIGKLAWRRPPPAVELEKLAGEITRLDERINVLGLTHPAAKPVADIFAKRKENLRGDDIGLLSRETLKCYKRLAEESARMSEILVRLAELFANPPAELQAGFNSISVAVPGR